MTWMGSSFAASKRCHSRSTATASRRARRCNSKRFRERCLERIRGFKAAGVTMVLVSHERDLVERLSDHVVLFSHGCAVAEGTAAAAFAAYEGLVRGDGT